MFFSIFVIVNGNFSNDVSELRTLYCKCYHVQHQDMFEIFIKLMQIAALMHLNTVLVLYYIYKQLLKYKQIVQSIKTVLLIANITGQQFLVSSH